MPPATGWIALSEWTPFVVGRAVLAHSTERRFSRWLNNPRIDGLRLYMALLRQALSGVPGSAVRGADTTVLPMHLAAGWEKRGQGALDHRR
jgi:hypothetical protein